MFTKFHQIVELPVLVVVAARAVFASVIPEKVTEFMEKVAVGLVPLALRDPTTLKGEKEMLVNVGAAATTTGGGAITGAI